VGHWESGTWERGALRECGTIRSDGAEVRPVGLGYRIGFLTTHTTVSGGHLSTHNGGTSPRHRTCSRIRASSSPWLFSRQLPQPLATTQHSVIHGRIAGPHTHSWCSFTSPTSRAPSSGSSTSTSTATGWGRATGLTDRCIWNLLPCAAPDGTGPPTATITSPSSLLLSPSCPRC